MAKNSGFGGSDRPADKSGKVTGVASKSISRTGVSGKDK